MSGLVEPAYWGCVIVASLDQQNVVVAQGVRHDDEVLAVDLFDEGLVTTDVADVVTPGPGVALSPRAQFHC